MGNCLAIEGKVKIIKNDGEVLRCSAPLQVQHVLSEFEGHVIAQSTASHQLQLGAYLQRGRLFHLPPVSSPEALKQQSTAVTLVAEKETTTKCDDRFDSGSGGLLRIKLLVTKQQLADMLNKGVSVEDMTSGHYDESFGSPNSRGWTPSLRTIPEASDELIELP